MFLSHVAYQSLQKQPHKKYASNITPIPTQKQGALYGARSLAMGVGPLVFAAVFRAFSRSDSGWPTFPGAPFVLGAVVSAVALALAVSLPGAPGAPTLKRDEQGDEERATLLGDDVR